MFIKTTFCLEKKKDRMTYYLLHFTFGVIVAALVLIGWTSKYILGDNLVLPLVGLILVAFVIVISNYFILRSNTSRGKHLVKGMLILLFTVGIELTILLYFISNEVQNRSFNLF